MIKINSTYANKLYWSSQAVLVGAWGTSLWCALTHKPFEAPYTTIVALCFAGAVLIHETHKAVK